MSRVSVRTDGPSLLEGFRKIVGDAPVRALEEIGRAHV